MPSIVLAHSPAQSWLIAGFCIKLTSKGKTRLRTSSHLTVIPQKNERKQGEQNETDIAF